MPKISELTSASSLVSTDTIPVVQSGTTKQAPLSLLAALLSSGSGTSGYVIVASNDAPAAVKSAADYVCDGTADQVEINSAISDAAPLYSRNTQSPAGALQKGKVLLTGGRFVISAPVAMRTGVHLAGAGRLSELYSSSNTGTGTINLASTSEHLVEVSDLYMYGNYASGGTCAAIYFNNTSPANIGTYPTASPDADHYIHDLFIDGYKGSTRNGIVMYSTSSDNRGAVIRDIQMRNIQGNGIWVTGASDGFIGNCHIGTITGHGYAMQGGNWKMYNNKSFYCDTTGLYATSGRSTCVGFESQDDYVGVFIDAEPWTLSGITIDTSSQYGLRVGSSGVVVDGFSVFNRSGGRYGTTTTGVYLDGTYTDMVLTGVSDAGARMTNSHSGTPGARSFVRVADGVSALWTVG